MIVRDLPELWRPDQDGHPCKAPAMPAGRCRVHGGADAPRAPPISGRIGHYSSSSTCLLLLIDHRRNRLRKLRPRSRGRFRIRVESGHKPKLGSVQEVYLAGQRKPSPISLESYASLAAIGRAIFGHSDEPSAAGLIAGLWRALGHKARTLLSNVFSFDQALVTTFYTYPEPTPNRPDT
jgi:hypothetical protein